MQIATYISQLLYRHECVVLPDFGAFISRRVPAQHFMSSHTIYPPKKGLSFNINIKQNDGLLVNHVAMAASITYTQALQAVRDYVRLINQELDDNKVFTIHKIGRFALSNDGVLQFTPMYVVNYLPEAFGLTAHETYAVDRTPVVTMSGGLIDSDDTAVVTTTLSHQSPYRRIARYAAIGVIAIGIGALGPYQYKTHQTNQQAVVEQLSQQQFERQVQEATFAIGNPLPSIEIEIAPVVKNYHIIAGAFRNPDNADKKVKQLQHQGYNAQRIGVNKYGLHNVAFDSYSDRNDAINALNQLRNLGHTGAWLLTGSLTK